MLMFFTFPIKWLAGQTFYTDPPVLVTFEKQDMPAADAVPTT